MKKTTSPSKKINWESLKKRKIPRTALTVGELFKQIQRSLRSINEPDVFSAVLQLQGQYISGTKRQAREAVEVLKRLLIPPGPKERMHDLRQRGEHIIALVDYYKQRVGPGWDKGKTPEERRRQALKCLDTWAITKKQIRELRAPRTVRPEEEHFIDFVTRCAARLHGYPPDEFRNLYYSVKKRSNAESGVRKTQKKTF